MPEAARPGALGAVRGGARAYADVLATPQARRVFTGGLIGRFREAGTGLALVLSVREVHGSFALAGLASAAYLAGAAITRPLHGRWIDRGGVRRPLLIASSLNALALLAVAIAAAEGAAATVLIGLSVLVGLSLPALSAALRAMWPRLAPAAGEHAYAVDTLSYELTLILSPVLVGVLAGVSRAWVALIVVAVLGALGTAVVAGFAPGSSVSVDAAAAAGDAAAGVGAAGDAAAAATAGVGAARGAAATAGDADAGVPGDPRMPRSARIVRGLIALSLFVGAAEGAMTVLAPGVASARGLHAEAGLLLAALSAGSLVGVLLYGPLSRRGSLGSRLVALCAALALALVALGLFGASMAGFAACAALAGLALSPAITACFVAIRHASSPAAMTETFTWASFAASAGAAGAQSVCGVLIAGPGIGSALWLPALAALAAVGVAVAVRRAILRFRLSAR